VKQNIPAQPYVRGRNRADHNVENLKSTCGRCVSIVEIRDDFGNDIRSDVGDGPKIHVPHPVKITARSIK
jgi:hypothetical protein